MLKVKMRQHCGRRSVRRRGHRAHTEPLGIELQAPLAARQRALEKHPSPGFVQQLGATPERTRSRRGRWRCPASGYRPCLTEGLSSGQDHGTNGLAKLIEGPAETVVVLEEPLPHDRSNVAADAPILDAGFRRVRPHHPGTKRSPGSRGAQRRLAEGVVRLEVAPVAV